MIKPHLSVAPLHGRRSVEIDRRVDEVPETSSTRSVVARVAKQSNRGELRVVLEIKLQIKIGWLAGRFLSFFFEIDLCVVVCDSMNTG